MSAVFIYFYQFMLFQFPNTYKAEIYLVPPQDNLLFVQPLNYLATQIAKDSQLILEQKLIYFGFMKNAQSRKYQRKYFYVLLIYITIFLSEDRRARSLKNISMITSGLGWSQNLFLGILGKKIF